MNTGDKMRWILFFVFLVLFIIVTVCTIIAVFTELLTPDPADRQLLLKVFVAEIGVAVVALFYGLFGLRRRGEDTTQANIHDSILTNGSGIEITPYIDDKIDSTTNIFIKLRSEIIDEIKNENIDDRSLVKLLGECFKLLDLKDNVIQSAMTLDYISNWINNDYIKYDKENKISIERIANIADYACSAASRNAAKQLEGLEAIRFAELSTWALGRCRDYKLCIDACEFGLSIIDKSSAYIEKTLLFLTKSEFTRIKSSAFSNLSAIFPDKSNGRIENLKNRDIEIDKLSNYFDEYFESNKIISLEEWKNIDNKVPSIFQKSKKSGEIIYVFAAFGDCISAIYLLLLLYKMNFTPIWLEKDSLNETVSIEEFDQVIIIGGPDVWKRHTNIINKFKSRVSEEKWDSLYPSEELTFEVIEVESGGNQKYYLAAGESKISTQQAIIELKKRII